MKDHRLRLSIAALCCASFLFPPAAGAADSGQKAAEPLASSDAPGFSRDIPIFEKVVISEDIGLRDGSVLVGRVVNSHGAAHDKAPVSIQRNGREVIRVVTNADGEFTVAGLKSGNYLIAAPGFRGVYRMWAPRTAPPSASKMLRFASGPMIENEASGEDRLEKDWLGDGLWRGGAEHCASLKNWVADHPLLVAGIVSEISYPLVAYANAGSDLVVD